MVTPAPNNSWDRLYRALRPTDPSAPIGAWQLITTGTVHIGGGAVGGAGGTSMTDDDTFIPGGTSITPMGGYVGGRQVASGNAGAPALSGSGIMQVHVVAGGAGGGVANLTMQGTAGNDVSVGVASGAAGAAGNWALPVQYASGLYATVNVGVMPGLVGSVRTTNLGGSVGALGIGGSVGAINAGGSVGVIGAGGSMGVTQIGAPWSVLGSVGVTQLNSPWGVVGSVHISNAGDIGAGGGGFASVAVYGSPGMPVYNVGSVHVVNAVGVFGSMTGIQTVNLATHIDTANSAVRVNVVTGGAGGGNANLTVQGTAGADFKVGYASHNLGAWPNYDGGAWMPVMFPSGFYPTVNIAGGGAGGGFASVAVYGSPAMPVYIVGSAHIVNGSLPAINLGGSVGVIGAGGSLGAVNLGGSVGVTQITSPWVMVGSVGVTPVAAFSLAGVPVVNPLGSLTPTQWIISGAASGQFVVAGSAPAGLRVRLSSFQLVAEGTIDMRWMSPSGVSVSGSMRILPGAGFGMAGAIPNSPVLLGSQQSAIYIHSAGTQNIGGVAVGWIE